MSYILDALKKSDQQRQRGATPTLSAAQVTVAAPKQLVSVYYILIAAVLLCAGIAIGWLRPWQPKQPDHAVETIAAVPTITPSNQDTPKNLSAAPEPVRNMGPTSSASNPASDVQITPQMAAIQTETAVPIVSMNSAVVAVPVPISKKPASSPDAAPEQKVTVMDALPLSIQQEIPAMTIQLHSYSSNPVNSLVSINSRLLKEGDFLSAGLKLEQITPDGVILSYKGYIFRKGMF